MASAGERSSARLRGDDRFVSARSTRAVPMKSCREKRSKSYTMKTTVRVGRSADGMFGNSNVSLNTGASVFRWTRLFNEMRFDENQ